MSLFSKSGKAPSLKTVVELAQSHVTERDKSRARAIDDKVFFANRSNNKSYRSSRKTKFNEDDHIPHTY